MTENPALSKRIVLSGIDGAAFQHPADREATDSLKKLVGFDKVVAKFLELRYERLLYIVNVASSVRVGPKQFPRLYGMLREGCEILDVPEPELYVSQRPLVNAFTFGYTNPYTVLFTGLLDLMTDDEIKATIAHELGHIKCGHVLYSTMANSIRDVLALLSQITFGLGGFVKTSVEITLMDWRRRSELSADRASLLVMQNLRPCVTMLTKLAGGTRRFAGELDPDEFLAQARLYAEEKDRDALDTIYRSLAEVFQGNHPFAVERVKELDAWARSPEYAQILAGDYARGIKTVKVKVQR
jgi:Zn-dependent protease with chaperone function